MAMRREDDVIVVDDDFISLVEAAEANALSNKRRKIVNGDESISIESTKENEEGAYTAALKGSKSNLWKQASFDSGNSRSRGGALKAITNNFSALAESANSDNGCFKCGKLGHWAGDCDAPGGGIDGDRGELNDSMPEKPCSCGLGSCSVLTANTERNRGRKFYKCPVREENGGCGFFEWCDNASAIPMSSGVQYSSAKSSFPDLPCPCGVGSCLVLTAKTGQNVGQQFYRCPANQANSCGFIKWCIDRNIGAGYQPSNSHYANTQSSPGTGGSSSCFKWGQGGHWARDCPKPSTPSTGIGRMGSMGAMGGKSAPSGTWGQGGHWAMDYPKPSTPSTGIGRMGNMGAMGGKSASSGTWGQGGRWTMDCPKPSTPSTGIGRMGNMGAMGGKSASSGTWGQGGRWTMDCPKPTTPSTGIGRMGNMGAMGGKSAPSGTWGQGGHWAMDCPKPSTPSTGIGRMGSMGAMGGNSAPSDTCYRCGKSGHWAKDYACQDLKFGNGTTRKAPASYSSFYR